LSAHCILACILQENMHTQPCCKTCLGDTMDKAITRFIQIINWRGTFQAVNQPSDNSLPVPWLTLFQHQFHGIKRMMKSTSHHCFKHHRFHAILSKVPHHDSSNHKITSWQCLSGGQYDNKSALPTFITSYVGQTVMVFNPNSNWQSTNLGTNIIGSNQLFSSSQMFWNA
jgi:hypothetical protein